MPKEMMAKHENFSFGNLNDAKGASRLTRILRQTRTEDISSFNTQSQNTRNTRCSNTFRPNPVANVGACTVHTKILTHDCTKVNHSVPHHKQTDVEFQVVFLVEFDVDL